MDINKARETVEYCERIKRNTAQGKTENNRKNGMYQVKDFPYTAYANALQVLEKQGNTHG
jgi:hypothetical protein